MKTTLPYSPILLAKASVKPEIREGRISGKMTRRKVVLRSAPRIMAASSY